MTISLTISHVACSMKNCPWAVRRLTGLITIYIFGDMVLLRRLRRRSRESRMKNRESKQRGWLSLEMQFSILLDSRFSILDSRVQAFRAQPWALNKEA